MRAGTIDVRVTPDEKETIRKAAEQAGLPMATWTRMILLREAQKVPG
jgi:uncharacterized protein (DUF1778 family)